jgi:hypothetical protein
MFARLPPSSSELTERKALFGNLLLQTGGANIAQAAYFVVARRLGVCRLTPPQPAARDPRFDPYAIAFRVPPGSFLRHAAEILDSAEGDH